MRVFAIDGRQVGVVLWHGEAFALRNVCPHEYGPVCEGFTLPLIVGEDTGALQVDDDRLVVVCPWHGWEFDARTGRAVWQEKSKYNLRTYPTHVQDGRVLVDVGRAPRSQKSDRPVTRTRASHPAADAGPDGQTITSTLQAKD